jgi:hypothetical protein
MEDRGFDVVVTCRDIGKTDANVTVKRESSFCDRFSS